MQEKNGFKEFLCTKAGKVVMITALYVIILGLMTVVTRFISTNAGAILALVFAVFGWKALNKIQPNVFLIMPIAGWLIYFLIKGMLSIFIGVFVAPFVIAKKITESIQDNM